MARTDAFARLPRRAIWLSVLALGFVGVIGWLSLQANSLVSQRMASLTNESVPSLQHISRMQESLQDFVLQLHLYYTNGQPRHWFASKLARDELEQGLRDWAIVDLSAPATAALQAQIAQMATEADQFHRLMQTSGERDFSQLRQRLSAALNVARGLALRLRDASSRVRDQVVSNGAATAAEVARLNRIELSMRVATVLVALVIGALVLTRVRSQGELLHLSNHDRLTRLPNRYRLRTDWDAMVASNRNRSRCHSLMVLRLDRFQMISGALGHQSGNQVELALTDRVKACMSGLGDADTTLYRLVAGTWLVLLRDDAEQRHCHTLKEALLSANLEPLQAGERELSVSCSIGMAFSPDHASDIDELLQCAGASLHAAQADGGNRAVIYRSEIKDDAERFLATESALRSSLRSGDFELFYQPKLAAGDLRCVGAEALIRWRRDGQWVSPGEFIPVAEASGLILPMGRWVLEQAARQWRAWLEDDLPPFPVAVNVSAQQFLSPGFVEEVATILHDFGMPASMLELEITEEATFGDAERASLTLRALRALGVRLAIDDFGTGYSSLSYLTSFPLDVLKIDRKFVADMESSPQHRAIVEMIVDLAHRLDFEVVAEGVETEEQQNILRDIGCAQFQGFLYSRPVNASEYRIFLRNNLLQQEVLEPVEAVPAPASHADR